MRKSVAPAAQTLRWQQRFMSLLPQIEGQARFAFRHFKPEALDEAVQEVTANSLVAFVRLVDQGREDVASPTSLARFAIRHYFAGRRTGVVSNGRDIHSPICRQRHGVGLQSLFQYDEQEDVWRELLVEDRQATPADVAVTRIDFPEWLKTLSRRDRRIALRLAQGDSTSDVARRFLISPGRISQLRRRFADLWQQFQGEPCRELAGAVPA